MMMAKGHVLSKEIIGFIISLSLLFLSFSLYADELFLCDASKGLELINEADYSAQQIKMILIGCDKVAPNAPDVLLLHGLLAKKEAEKTKNYQQALFWLEKARMATFPKQTAASMELAATYEAMNKYPKAVEIYQSILKVYPTNRAALLSQARVFRLQNNLYQASLIYYQLLSVHPNDVQALNGLGWIATAKKNNAQARFFFQQSLGLESENQEALIALSKIQATELQAIPINPDCDSVGGLALLSRAQPPLPEITAILEKCDKNAPHDINTYLLHGLLARTVGKNNKQYETALFWLSKAWIASNEALNPSLELAVTFEWAGKLEQAKHLYENVLARFPGNKAAQLGMQRVIVASFIVPPTLIPPPSLCNAMEGLALLDGKNPPMQKIQSILKRCDRYAPLETSTLRLHGLLARKFAKENGDYAAAIYWLHKAVDQASTNDLIPVALELAITYEWAGQLPEAMHVYRYIQLQHPNNKSALLGEARVFRQKYELPASLCVYQRLLALYPKDAEVLSEYGLSLLTNLELQAAHKAFNETLALDGKNPLALSGLKSLEEVTKYSLSLTGGHYTVPPETSNALNLYFLDNLNATDSLTIFATHNTKQIGEGFFSGPTLLPNNSILFGFQQTIPLKQGWGLSYDFRQHNGLPDEHRIEGIANLFLFKNIEYNTGLRIGFGSPWNNKLLYSRLTAYQFFPVNVSFSGFWAHQQVGGPSQSYSLDFSKEYGSRLFYSFGPSYSPTLDNWEIHGRLIWPVFKNQAFVADFSHYYFNNSTFINAGWRLYWA